MASEVSVRIAQGLPPKDIVNETVTFKWATREWLNLQSEKVTPAYLKDITQRLEKHILPVFGPIDIKEIRPKQILDTLQAISATGVKDTVKRLRMYMSLIFRYAIVAEYCDSDPAASIQAALPKIASKRMPVRTEPEAVKALFHACCYYGASQTVRNALLFQALTAIRPGNAQNAE